MKYYLLGEKLSHSFSAKLHRRFGLDYELKEVESWAISRLLNEKDFKGLNVTIPYKKTIMPFLDDTDDTARRIGAVNTVVNKGGKLIGYNTDYFGLKFALDYYGIELSGENVMILGNGGAAAACKTLAGDEKAKSVTVVERKGEINFENCYNVTDTSVIINATPVGMFPCAGISPVDSGRFPNLKAVFDCVYNPVNTEFLRLAENLGIKRGGGLLMLVAQGMYSEYLWGEADNFKEKILPTYRDILFEESNIVLIGMPSAGKTTIGKAISEKLGREFYDTDEMISARYKITPEKIIEEKGEPYFREIEKEVVKELDGVKGSVISTGGGTVLSEKNVRVLRSDGVVVFLERDEEKLTENNRPLSKNGAISRLLRERTPIYENICDIKIRNDGSIEETAESVLSAVKARLEK